MLTPEMRDAAMRLLEARKATAPEPIENASRQAGEPMVFYCVMCGWECDRLPEGYFLATPRRLCSECEALTHQLDVVIEVEVGPPSRD